MEPVTAYRHKRKIIRAEELRETQIYICPHTNVEFEDRGQFGNHLIQLRRTKTAVRNHNKLSEELRSQPTLRGIQDFFNDNPILCVPNKIISSKLIDFINPNYKFTISFFNMKYKNSCSNSHNAPFGKPTNWSSDDDKPTGYQGLYGRVRVVYDHTPPCKPITAEGERVRKKEDVSYFTVSERSSDTLKSLGIRTGSGGGGGGSPKYILEYDVTLFLDDWEELQYKFIERKLMGELRDGETVPLDY